MILTAGRHRPFNSHATYHKTQEDEGNDDLRSANAEDLTVFMRLLYCFIALLLKFEISLRLGQTDIYATGKMHASKPRSIFLFP